VILLFIAFAEKTKGGEKRKVRKKKAKRVKFL